jgi:hypothetical protein
MRNPFFVLLGISKKDEDEIDKIYDLSPGAITYTGPPRIGFVPRELSILEKLNKYIDRHYKGREDLLIIELTPRDIWEISCCLEIKSRHYNTFITFESGAISVVWWKGAKLVRKEEICR